MYLYLFEIYLACFFFSSLMCVCMLEYSVLKLIQFKETNLLFYI